MSDSTRQIGRQGENAACDWLSKNGYEIIQRNYTSPHGEIDIIAEDEKYIVFVEVKYRKNSSFGAPEEAVTTAKQKKIIRGAKLFLYQNRYPTDTPCRFDVVSVYGDEINWIKDAFTLTGW